jgi:hypothetical protein
MTSLGLNTRHGSLNVLSWEGLTFQQVVGSLQKNGNSLTNTKSFFYPAPLKHYRRNIGRTADNLPLPSSSNERQSVTISAVMEQPGGAVRTTVPICSNNGVEISTDAKMPNMTYDNMGCNVNGTTCMNVRNNALTRVRSAGMIKKRNYNVNSYQYLQNRDRTFSQNNFNYLKTGNSSAVSGSALASSNTYVQNASGQFNVANNVVIYKPSNSKFGQQGGVSSSSRLERLKLDTIEKVAGQYKQTYGTNSCDYKSSVTYSGSNGTYNGATYGRKDLYNVPTPQIIRVAF